MEYQIPQFIEIESKIIFGLEFKQVIGFLVVFGFLGLLYLLLKPVAFLIIAVPVGALAIAFGFIKVNGKNFFDFLMSVFTFMLGSQTYLWKREYDDVIFKEQKIDLSEAQIVKKHKHGPQNEKEVITTKILNPHEVDKKISEIAKKLNSSHLPL
jgi:hypothetical protein